MSNIFKQIDMKLDQAIANASNPKFKDGFNTLLIGHAGIGKTSMVINALKRAGKTYKYFSAATMDPWVDFVGVPTVVENNGSRSLEFILPKSMMEDQNEFIILDEYNRAHARTRNAVMELIQFKQINGRRYTNLKGVFAMINPDDDDMLDYDVEKLDLAQKDRFHMIIRIKNDVINTDYFAKKYDHDTAKAAQEWYKGLTNSTRQSITPRRLDYMIDMYKNMGMNLDDAIDSNVTVDLTSLKKSLDNGSPEKKLRELIANNDDAKLKAWLQKEAMTVEDLITGMDHPEITRKCVPLMDTEMVMRYICSGGKYTKFRSEILNEHTDNPKRYIDILRKIKDSHTKGSQIQLNAIALLNKIDPIPDENKWKTKLTPKDFQSSKSQEDHFAQNWFIKYDTNNICNTSSNALSKEDMQQNIDKIIYAVEKDNISVKVKEDCIDKLHSTVKLGMGIDIARQAIEIIEYICSRSSAPTIEGINNIPGKEGNFIKTINTCIVEWANLDKTVNTVTLLKYAPYLIVKSYTTIYGNSASPEIFALNKL